MKIGNALRELRKRKGLSRQEVADAIEISVNTYIKYENELVNPAYDNLVKLADFYGVTTDYLLGREAPAPETPLRTFAKGANLKELEEILIKEYLELDDKQREAVLDFLRRCIGKEQILKNRN